MIRICVWAANHKHFAFSLDKNTVPNEPIIEGAHDFWFTNFYHLQLKIKMWYVVLMSNNTGLSLLRDNFFVAPVDLQANQIRQKTVFSSSNSLAESVRRALGCNCVSWRVFFLLFLKFSTISSRPAHANALVCVWITVSHSENFWYFGSECKRKLDPTAYSLLRVQQTRIVDSHAKATWLCWCIATDENGEKENTKAREMCAKSLLYAFECVDWVVCTFARALWRRERCRGSLFGSLYFSCHMKNQVVLKRWPFGRLETKRQLKALCGVLLTLTCSPTINFFQFVSILTFATILCCQSIVAVCVCIKCRQRGKVSIIL